MASPMIALKGPLMEKKDYSPNFPLKHAQKDMRFALGLGDKVGLSVLQLRACHSCWRVSFLSSRSLCCFTSAFAPLVAVLAVPPFRSIPVPA